MTVPLVLAALAASPLLREYWCSLSASHFVAAGPPISLMLRDNCAGGEDGGCRVGERLSYEYGDSWEPMAGDSEDVLCRRVQVRGGDVHPALGHARTSSEAIFRAWPAADRNSSGFRRSLRTVMKK